jgi:hypothetical protein
MPRRAEILGLGTFLLILLELIDEPIPAPLVARARAAPSPAPDDAAADSARGGEATASVS